MTYEQQQIRYRGHARIPLEFHSRSRLPGGDLAVWRQKNWAIAADSRREEVFRRAPSCNS